MSRRATPTDNPIMEALSDWIKEKLFLDYGLATAENVPVLLDTYVHYFNHERPAAALGYKSPVQYRTELGFWKSWLFYVSTFTWQLQYAGGYDLRSF